MACLPVSSFFPVQRRMLIVTTIQTNKNIYVAQFSGSENENDNQLKEERWLTLIKGLLFSFSKSFAEECLAEGE